MKRHFVNVSHQISNELSCDEHNNTKKASVQDAIECDTRTPGCHLTTIASFPKNKILGFQELSSLFLGYSNLIKQD